MDKNVKELLTAAGQALYGGRWQTDLARDLGFSDGRRVRQWLSGDRPIPESALKDLRVLLEERKKLIGTILDDLGGANGQVVTN